MPPRKFAGILDWSGNRPSASQSLLLVLDNSLSSLLITSDTNNGFLLTADPSSAGQANLL